MRKLFFLFLFFLLNSKLVDGQVFIVTGQVVDKLSGEYLPYADIIWHSTSNKNSGTITNKYGYFQIKIKNLPFSFKVLYLGYEEKEIKINLLHKDSSIKIELIPVPYQLSEIPVSAPKERFFKVNSGNISFDLNKASSTPFVLGEKDPLKLVQLMPGINPALENNTNLSIFGSRLDQSLILIDGTPIFNSGHTFGLFSAFNYPTVKSLKIYKNYIPPNFGGRAGGVIDVLLKEGNQKKYSFSSTIGLISSSLFAEGPITKNKGSWFISFRKSYLGYLIKLFPSIGTNFNIFDGVAKFNYKLSKKDNIFISSYFSQDNLILDKNSSLFTVDSKTSWKNFSAQSNWTRQLKNSILLTSLNFSTFQTNSGIKFNPETGIKRFSFKSTLKKFISNNLTMEMGLENVYQRLFNNFSVNYFNNLYNSRDIENSLFFEGIIQKGRLNLNIGARLSSFYNIDSSFYALNPEPRLNIVFKLNKNSNVFATYNKQFQHLHYFSSTIIPFPNNFYTNSTSSLSAERSHLATLGFSKTLKKFQVSTSFYWRQMAGLPLLKEGIEINKINLETDIIKNGIGHSNGIEFLLQKSGNKISGWLSYTFSKTSFLFKEINDSNWFPADYDLPHNLNINLSYKIKNFVLNFLFVYSSGRPVTIPLYSSRVILFYSEKNIFRLPDYHRLDFNLKFTPTSKNEKIKSEWNFNIYNVYNRMNIYSLIFNKLNNKIEAFTLFPILPSISYSLYFN